MPPLNYEINYDTLCVSHLYKVQLLEKLGQSFWPSPLTSKALPKGLALETLDVFWNVVAYLIIKEHCSLNLLAFGFIKIYMLIAHTNKGIFIYNMGAGPGCPF